MFINIKNELIYPENRSMKKFIAVTILLLVSVALFADEYVRPLWSLGTSAIFYGDPAIKDMNENLKRQDYKSLVITGEYGLSAQLDNRIDFVLLGYLTLDNLSNGNSSFLRLDYGITGGARLRPGLGGVSLGCEYCWGQRADINSLVSGTTDSSTTQWGNGYRFLFEYDFSSLLDGIAPVLGISYRTMPRGNNYRDGNLAFYFRLLA